MNFAFSDTRLRRHGWVRVVVPTLCFARDGPPFFVLKLTKGSYFDCVRCVRASFGVPGRLFGGCFWTLLFGVEEVEFLAWLEADGFAGGDGDFGSGARVAANAGLAGAHIEDAKAAQFNAIAGGEGLLQAFENYVDSCFRFVARQARTFDDVMDNILFYQRVHLCL